MAAATPMRLLRRSLLDTRWSTSIRPIATTTTTATSQSIEPPPLASRAHPIPSRELPTTPKIPQPSIHQPSLTPHNHKRKAAPAIPQSNAPRSAPTKPATPHTDPTLDPSIAQLLPLLKAQSPHYARIHIHAKPYLVTAGDTLRLPFYMHGVSTGDILRLTRATLVGSRDYTLKAGAGSSAGEMKGEGWIDERLFVCRARVVGVEMEPMRVKEKTERRRRHVRRVRSKHRFTVLRIMEVSVGEVEGAASA